MVIEKILGEHETLRPFADVHGTTGYEWLNAITQVLVDGSGLDPLDEIWRQISNMSPQLDPRAESGQTPGARDPADQRVHGADAAARAHCRGSLFDP